MKRLNYCKKCINICPVPDAIGINDDRTPFFTEHCNGCGQCVEVCPSFPKAIEIVW